MCETKTPITRGFCWGDLWEGEDGLLHCSCKHWIATVEAGISELPEAYKDYIPLSGAKILFMRRSPLGTIRRHVADLMLVLESINNQVKYNNETKQITKR